MISALHLIWIIPAAACFGFFICALFVGGKNEEDIFGE